VRRWRLRGHRFTALVTAEDLRIRTGGLMAANGLRVGAVTFDFWNTLVSEARWSRWRST
jgi:hypothetical protein